jgi:hypothetical protein
MALNSSLVVRFSSNYLVHKSEVNLVLEINETKSKKLEQVMS